MMLAYSPSARAASMNLMSPRWASNNGSTMAKGTAQPRPSPGAVNQRIQAPSVSPSESLASAAAAAVVPQPGSASR